jgi:hypothetical protein
MNCRESLDILQQHLDGIRPPSAESLAAHLRECPSCAGLHAAGRRLRDGLQLLKSPTPPTGLAPRISAAALRSVRRRRLARRGAYALALAAAVLAAVGIRFSFGPTPSAVPDHEIAKVMAPSKLEVLQPPPANPTPPPLSNTVAEVGEAVASLTSRTADEAVGQTRLLLPIVSGSSLASLDFPPPEAPARPLRQAGENLTAGLDPVADSARRAVDLFLRDLPPVRGRDRRGL